MLVDNERRERLSSISSFPSLGRFVEADPIGYEGGINLYAYVGNDPVNYTDPLGLIWVNGIRYRLACVGLEGGSLDCGYQPVENSYEFYWRSWEPLIYPKPIELDDCPLVLRRCGASNTPTPSPAPNAKKQRTKVPCDDLIKNDRGPVITATHSLTAIVGGGVTGSLGSFVNQKTGARGSFWTLGGGGGWDMGASSMFGQSTSLADLAGFGVGLNFGNGLGGSVNLNVSGNVTGLAAGAATPGKGASITGATTQLFQCSK